MALQIDVVPAFNDNYIWLISQPDLPHVYVVDPGDASPVLEWLQQSGSQLAGILLTHHHPDHTGGVERLLQHRSVPVYGPESARIPAVTDAFHDGDHLRILDTDFRVIEVPGHTLDHIAFLADPGAGQAPLLFCGDTLFASGCGRLFEGDPPMMLASLGKLASLPDTTRVYCAHEYTRANLAFARAAEPDNAAIAERERAVIALREQDRITLPSDLATEKRTNPFLRCHKESVRQRCSEHAGRTLTTEVDTFAALRQWKDNFQG